MQRIASALARRVAKLKRRLERLFIPPAGMVRAPRLYYYWLNSGLDREKRAVMAGRLDFERSRVLQGKTNSLLRRNIHRLEKGLIMRPRRDVFALDYITETMAKFAALASHMLENREAPGAEFRWFRDVLATYFAVTASHPTINPHRECFREIDDRFKAASKTAPRIPYRQACRLDSSINYDQYLTLCRQRKSVRWFADRKVPQEMVLKALEAAKYSPSACNRYPFFFHVFDEKAKVDIVATLPGGTVGFAQNFPVIIAIIGELRNYYGERDRHLIYVDASLAAMSVVHAAETLGLATCCINWPDIEEHEQRAERVLKLEPDQRPIMFMAMGYPDPEGLVCWSEKKPITEICRFNSELGSDSS